jgi:arylsulfatase A-like enzyme
MKAHAFRRLVLTCLAVGWPLAIAPARMAAAEPPPRPNVVVILTDDQGRGDYGAFGTPDLRTPNLDRLFREGMTFENFYANCCVCSPTRAALLTGRYPDRVGVPGVIRQVAADSWGHLSIEARLLPQFLKPAGYRSAIIGKWHLGLESPNTPLDRGFDFFHGFLGDMMDDYWTHLRGGRNLMRRDRAVIEPKGHATDVFTDWACTWIEEAAKVPDPFFLYLAYNAPHDPIQPPPEWLDKVRTREPGLSDRRAKLVALIEHLDWGIGRVLDTLKRLGVEERTLVFFTSDNGGVLDRGAHNGPWRSAKGHMYEGGLRVPAVARWPGRIAAGSRTDRVSVTMDLFPTILEAAGVPVPAGIDGVSGLRTLLGGQDATSGREIYFVRREGGMTFGGKTIEALRRGDWKLVQDSPYGPLELFNLRNDPRETTNLAVGERQVLNELAGRLREHTRRAGATPWQPPVTGQGE